MFCGLSHSLYLFLLSSRLTKTRRKSIRPCHQGTWARWRSSGKPPVKMEGRSSSTFSCHILLFMLDVEVFVLFLFFSRMRGKMRFWSKTKHSEKKLSREKQARMSEVGETRGKNKSYSACHIQPLSRFMSTQTLDVLTIISKL